MIVYHRPWHLQITLGSAKTMEAFLFVLIFMSISMILQGIPFREIMDTLTDGIKRCGSGSYASGAGPILNALSKSMGTCQYIVSLSEDF